MTTRPPRNRPNRSLPALARFGADRLKRAIERYWTFSEPTAAQPSAETLRESMAILVIDALAGVDAAIQAIRIARRYEIARNALELLIDRILAEPDAAAIPLDVVRGKRQIFQVRRSRNDFPHGGRPPSVRQEALTAVRDAIELVLYLFREFPDLRSAWEDVDDTIWRFTGQTAFVAGQIRQTFSNEVFTPLSVLLRVDREVGSDQFTLSGDLTAVGRVYTYFWRQNGTVPPAFDIFAANSIDVGAIESPLSAFGTANGTEEHTGMLECIIRGVDGRVDGFGHEPTPLSKPILLGKGEDSSWTYGPGDLTIDQLTISMPYRVQSAWYRTPEPRLHIVSTLIPDERCGDVSGRLRFFLHGHSGQPALRGTARVSGRTSPLERLLQRAEWDLIGGRAGTWSGVTRLHLRIRLDFELKFSAF